jgi:23S rRNA (guanine2445-N2)-methyltransferase / 23S rRNA (guanine2069-N7)-methyltransferase
MPQFFATTAKHLEALLAEELQGLGIAAARETRGGAQFEGMLEAGYRACLWSRVASRVLLLMGEFEADGPKALYAGAHALDWAAHLPPGASFAVDYGGRLPGIDHSHFGALTVKDALVDRLRAERGARPDVDADAPDLRINVYAHAQRVRIAVDLAGTALHRRGYRLSAGAAPLKETLAAAILLRAGWPAIAAAGGALADPLCGSGTLLIEGGWIAGDVAPGLLRERWGFSGWAGHDADLWARLRDEAVERRAAGAAAIPRLYGSDSDAEALRAARENAERAGLASALELHRVAVAQADSAPAGPGLVVTNPPYGARLGRDSELPGLYAALGGLLRRHYRGWAAAVFTGNPDLGPRIGLRSHRQHVLYNGPIACRLLHFCVREAAVLAAPRLPRPLPEAERGPGAVMLANRLRKNARALAKWRSREGVSCYRLYDADLPEYAFAVDCYEGERLWVHLQEYAAPPDVAREQVRVHRREAVAVILDTLGVGEDQVFFKLRERKRGSSQYERLADQGARHVVEEGGLKFGVEFERYLDTGLFLDHRLTRAWLRERASGRDFLNLFAYTGTASVYAAAGGARSTTSVDLSRGYLDWARDNLALNGYAGPRHRLLQEDVLAWLRAGGDGRRYGLVFLDPPSFSSSKRMQGTLDVQRDHVELLRSAARLLAPEGELVFSTNLRRFRLDAPALAEFELQDISRATLPRDFARNPRIRQCWVLRPRANTAAPRRSKLRVRH